jgi:hypothetical protein
LSGASNRNGLVQGCFRSTVIADCGVACNVGALVEQVLDIDGGIQIVAILKDERSVIEAASMVVLVIAQCD